MPAPYRGTDGGFTHVSIVKRLPQILDTTVCTLPDLDDRQRADLQRLREHLAAGSVPIEPLEHAPPDDVWRTYFDSTMKRKQQQHMPMTWLSVPWWFAENYFYRKVLDIMRYYCHHHDNDSDDDDDSDSGSRSKRSRSKYQGRDPFQRQKDLSIAAAVDTGAVHTLAEVVDRYTAQHSSSSSTTDNTSRSLIRQLCIAALWGNQADLSFSGGELHTDTHSDSNSGGGGSNGGGDDDDRSSNDSKHNDSRNILINDVDTALDTLFLHHHQQQQQQDQSSVLISGGTKKSKKAAEAVVVYIVDNCGLEFVCDLFLCDALVGCGLADTVRFLVKDAPTFVSDVMAKDVAAHIDYMAQHSDPLVQRYAQRFQSHMDSGRWQIAQPVDPFYTSPLYGWQWPKELVEREFASNESRSVVLVVCKGDANYRRLLGDCHWDPCEHDFQELLSQYFVAPLLVLRTMKSGCLVLGRDEQARRLFDRLNNNDTEGTSDPDMTWRESGKYGLICFYDHHRHHHQQQQQQQHSAK